MAHSYSSGPPETRAFHPRYPLWLRLGRLILTASFFISLFLAAGSPYRYAPSAWLALFGLGTLTSLLPFIGIRDILFLDQLVIRRHFLPEKYVQHNNLALGGPGQIFADGHRIQLGGIENLQELDQAIRRWSAARILKDASGTRRAPLTPYPTRGYGSYASIWGLLLGVISLSMQPAWLHVDPRWMMGGVFLVVYLLYIYIIPRLFP